MKNTDAKRKNNSMWSQAWKRLKRNKTAMFGLALLILVVLGAIFAGVVAPEGYDAQNLRNRFIAPSASHIFGTDQYGRDILVRVLYGARISLSVGFSAVVLSVTIGTIIGAYAAYYGKNVDNILMRFIDIWMAIPNILLAISVMAALGASVNNLVIAIAIGAIPGHARIVRSAVLSVINQEFIEAAVSNGASDFRIITRYILPNCLAPVIVQATMSVAKAILSASSLSFIGLGVQQPIPEWGAMLSVGRTYIRDYPWIITFPGLAIMITIYGINLFGDGLRDALDPRLKH
ncbi:ABC transporter permease [Lutispora sp.]|nr:ABC transporter permease [Lutispora sp.]MEA4962976.1 ABC transporter permease [Lutispora sp.]